MYICYINNKNKESFEIMKLEIISIHKFSFNRYLFVSRFGFPSFAIK